MLIHPCLPLCQNKVCLDIPRKIFCLCVPSYIFMFKMFSLSAQTSCLCAQACRSTLTLTATRRQLADLFVEMHISWPANKKKSATCSLWTNIIIIKVIDLQIPSDFPRFSLKHINQSCLIVFALRLLHIIKTQKRTIWVITLFQVPPSHTKNVG